MNRRFTGWHMLATMVAFFGVIVTVNMTMATLASRTFGGLVVKNSYVANQNFNGWLAEAREQRKLGWSAGIQVADRRVLVIAGNRTALLAGATVTAVAAHPLGSVPEIMLRFDEVERGRYVAATRLPAGRWRLRLRITRGAERADFVKDVAA
jgi:nitrogen fixation protein FixH